MKEMLVPLMIVLSIVFVVYVLLYETSSHLKCPEGMTKTLINYQMICVVKPN